MSDEITSLKELKALDALFLKRFPDHYYPITQKKPREKIEFISTDCFSLDKVFGAGIPIGRCIELAGENNCFKSSIGYHCIASYQRKNKVCALIDTENSYSRDYAESLGIDSDKLMILSGCFLMEDYLEGLRMLVKSPAVDLILLDSVSAMTPKRIAEGDVGDATMALQARLWSTHLPEIVPYLKANKITLLLINQLRNTLALYGNPSESTGGKALKYYTSVRVQVSKKEVIKEKGKEIGVKVQLKNVKTKVGKPFVTKLISIFFPQFPGDPGGIDILSDIVDSALDEGIIKQSGSMYTWREFSEAKDGEKKLRGKEAVYEFFKQNPTNLELLKEDLLNNSNNNYDNSTTKNSNQEEDYQEEAA
jgi:recombination protein RecA